jgi:uncharacterized protein with HEPN domain
MNSESIDPLVLVEDILESLEKIESYMDGVSEQMFLASTEKQDAVYRRFEVMGEASNRLPKSFRDEHPEIPWRKIISTRNVLAHEYDRVVSEIVWDTIVNQLPGLRARLILLDRC